MRNSSFGFTWAPFGGKVTHRPTDDVGTLLEDMLAPKSRTFDFNSDSDNDNLNDDDPQEESTTRTLSEDELPPSIKRKLERKRRQ